MSPLLATAALLLAQPPAVAGDATLWERVSTDGISTLFIDAASIRREGNSTRVRWRSDYVEINARDGMRALILQAAVDCRARTYSFRRVEGYREDGALIQAHDLADDDAQAAPRQFGAADEALVRRICG